MALTFKQFLAQEAARRSGVDVDGAPAQGTDPIAEILQRLTSLQGDVASTGRTVKKWVYSGTLVIGAGATPRTLDRDQMLVAVVTTVNLAPTGQPILVDLNADGASVFPNQADRPSIAAGQLTDTVDGLQVLLEEGTDLTADIDQVGSTFAGGTLTVQAVLIG